MLVDWLPWNHTFGGNHNFGLDALQRRHAVHRRRQAAARQLVDETVRNLREIAPTVYFNVPRGFEEIARALAAIARCAKTFFSRVKMLFYAAAACRSRSGTRSHELAVRDVRRAHRHDHRPRIDRDGADGDLRDLAGGRAPARSALPVPGMELKLVPVGDKLEVACRGRTSRRATGAQPELTRAGVRRGRLLPHAATRCASSIRDDVERRASLFDGRIAEDFKLSSGTWVNVGPLRAQVIAHWRAVRARRRDHRPRSRRGRPRS